MSGRARCGCFYDDDMPDKGAADAYALRARLAFTCAHLFDMVVRSMAPLLVARGRSCRAAAHAGHFL